jgi:uncharacterized protein with GYD domain
MPRYVTLIRFTDQGAKGIAKSPTRARAFAAAAKKDKVTVEAQYWTTGSRDGVLIVSAKDKKKALRCLAHLSASGNVHTETLQAFDAREFQAIVGKK